MANGLAPFVARLLAKHGRLVTLSFFIGFGLSACSGGDSADEPVKGEDQVSDAQANDATAELEKADAAPPAEGAPAEAAPSETPPQETAGPVEESMPADGAAQPGVIDQQTDTVNAELTDNSGTPPPNTGQTQPVVDTPDTSATDSMANNLEPEPALADSTVPPPPAMQMGGNVIASPGAAQFIKGTHENHAHNKKGKHHKNTAVASSGGNGGSGDGLYVVQSGDTLAGIAQKIYGGTSHWKALAGENGLTAPYLLHPGDEVKFDASNATAKSFASGLKGNMKTVTVEHGDTLITIAEKVLGSAHAWKELLSYNKNRISDPNMIYTGMKLSYVDKNDTAAAPAAATKKKVSTAVAPPAKAKAKPVAVKAPTKKAGGKTAAKKSKQAPPISAEALGE